MRTEQENQMIELCAQHVYAKDAHGKQRMPFEHWPMGGKLIPPRLYTRKGKLTASSDPLSTMKAALDASLERKVLSLERDRWMFEGDGKSKN